MAMILRRQKWTNSLSAFVTCPQVRESNLSRIVLRTPISLEGEFHAHECCWVADPSAAAQQALDASDSEDELGALMGLVGKYHSRT